MLRYKIITDAGVFVIYRGDAVLTNREKHNPVKWYFVGEELENEFVHVKDAAATAQEAEHRCLAFATRYLKVSTEFRQELSDIKNKENLKLTN